MGEFCARANLVTSKPCLVHKSSDIIESRVFKHIFVRRTEQCHCWSASVLWHHLDVCEKQEVGCTFECFFIDSVSTFSLDHIDHFHIWKTDVLKRKWCLKCLSWPMRGLCAQETDRQVNTVSKSEDVSVRLSLSCSTAVVSAQFKIRLEEITSVCSYRRRNSWGYIIATHALVAFLKKWA